MHEGNDSTTEDVMLMFDVTISSGATENEKVDFATSDGSNASQVAVLQKRERTMKLKWKR